MENILRGRVGHRARWPTQARNLNLAPCAAGRFRAMDGLTGLKESRVFPGAKENRLGPALTRRARREPLD